MPPVQPNASVAATGLGLRYIGSGADQYAYAYSGTINMDNNAKSMLLATSGSGIIKAQFQYQNFSRTTLGWSFTIKLNDILVCDSFWTTGFREWADSVKLIVPPFTKLEVLGQNIDSTSAKNWGVTMTGRVYGAE